MKTLHLICNAHLDPVWQWEWEEGAAAAISTFRSAAALCEEFDGFVFNHNEALLYEWIEEHEPSLFRRIQRLVAQGKWHIMGGWHLQPDCNMPSGESFVRQIVRGKRYFMQKFGVEPTTAVNFDSFGHTRGLVQILRKTGYGSYLFMRPGSNELSLPADDFLWVGFDGSAVHAHRICWGYNSVLGHGAEKVTDWLGEHGDEEVSLLAWGVGNHGGGPSRKDLRDIGNRMAGTAGVRILHSTPEAYFRQAAEAGMPLPRVASDLNPHSRGCYTSQIRIKQRHRALENEYFMAEKMLSAAALHGLLEYPSQELGDALRDLLTCEFHDILPGSSVQGVEESSLRLIDHGLESVSRLKARAFFALAAGQPAAREGEYPILIYNPHPYPVTGVFECEFMLADQNWKEEFSSPVVYQGGVSLPSQPEKENSNISLDWRKRVAFAATLSPSCMNRYDARVELLPGKPKPEILAEDGEIVFQTDDLRVVIDCVTGLVNDYRAGDACYLLPGAFRPIAVNDYDDSWGATRTSWREICGEFRLMTPEEAAVFSGAPGRKAEAVRVVEDGDVRTVVEVLFTWGDSRICQRYKLPKKGCEIELETRVYWAEKAKMLKLLVPTALPGVAFHGQTAYGSQALLGDGTEVVCQKWCAAVSKESGRAFTCVNDGTYGLDCMNGEFRLSLLRSPGYTCVDMSQFGADRPMMPDDRFSPRMDQGERVYHFWFCGGPADERMAAVDREALAHNEKPCALSFFPGGEGIQPEPAVVLDGGGVLLTALKQAEDSDGYIIRLFEATGCGRQAVLRVPPLGVCQPVTLAAHEIKTLLLDVDAKTVMECDMLETVNSVR